MKRNLQFVLAIVLLSLAQTYPSLAHADRARPACDRTGILTSGPIEVDGEGNSTSPSWAIKYAQVKCEGNASWEGLRQLIGLWAIAEDQCGEGCHRRTVRVESPVLIGCDDQSTELEKGDLNYIARSKGLVGALFEFRCEAD